MPSLPVGALSLHPDPGLPLQLHRARLEETVALFSFYSSCRELQSWLEEQTALFRTLQPKGDNLEVAQFKCEVSRCANGDRLKFPPPWRGFCLLLLTVLPRISRLLWPCLGRVPRQQA